MNDERSAKQSESAGRADGVDVTLIRWMLSLTPEERLRALERVVRSRERLKGGTIRA